MKQKSWSSQDISSAATASFAGGEGDVIGKGSDLSFDALLQSAMAVANGGEGGDPSCTAGSPPYWTRKL